MPIAGEFIYNLFWDLWERERGISWGNIHYYQEVYDITLSGEEISVLRAMSASALVWISKKTKKTSSKPTNNKGNSKHAPRRR